MASWRHADQVYRWHNSANDCISIFSEPGIEVLDDNGDRLFFLTRQWDHHVSMDVLARDIVDQINEQKGIPRAVT